MESEKTIKEKKLTIKLHYYLHDKLLLERDITSEVEIAVLNYVPPDMFGIETIHDVNDRHINIMKFIFTGICNFHILHDRKELNFNRLLLRTSLEGEEQTLLGFQSLDSLN